MPCQGLMLAVTTGRRLLNHTGHAGADKVSGCAGFDGSAFFFTGVPNKTYNILSTEVRPGCVVCQHAAVSRASSPVQHAG